MSNPNHNGVQKDCTGYEFAAGSMFVYRAWSVDARGRLAGSNGQVWKPGENVADCLIARRHFYVWEPTLRHPAPVESCTCGYYGFFRDGDRRFGTINGIRRRYRVFGIAEIYGRTLIGAKGARAEKARVVAIATGFRRAHLTSMIAAAYPEVAVYRSAGYMQRRHPVERTPWKDNPPSFDEIWGEK